MYHKYRLLMYVATALCAAPAHRAVAEEPPTRKLDAAIIETITGLKGSYIEAENVFKVSSPRTDAKISVDGTALPAFAGLTSWAAFQPGKGDKSMVMGDLVLLQDEVNAVMDAAFDGGLTVTALHNHFFYDEPRVYFMHIGGEGTTEQLATGVRKAFDKVQEVRKGAAQPASRFAGKAIVQPSNVTAKPIEEILGKKADVKEGMLKFSFGRSVKMSCGCEVGNAMGVNTWAAFVGGNEHAFVDGDFACLPGELQPTLKALRKAGVNIVAIHNHMEDEEPRVVFLHYWAKGSARELANAVKAGLVAQKGASDSTKSNDGAHKHEKN